MEYKIVFVTVSGEEEGKKISKQLVEERLVACVNVIPNIKSIYWWEGKVEESSEYLLIMKTVSERIDFLINRVKQLHSYDVPEVIALDIEKGNPDYLNWIAESIQCAKPSSKK